MPAPEVAGLPAFFTLDNGDTVTISAQDPVTGNTVAGVIVSNASLAVDPGSGASNLPPPNPVTGAYTTS